MFTDGQRNSLGRFSPWFSSRNVLSYTCTCRSKFREVPRRLTSPTSHNSCFKEENAILQELLVFLPLHILNTPFLLTHRIDFQQFSHIPFTLPTIPRGPTKKNTKKRILKGLLNYIGSVGNKFCDTVANTKLFSCEPKCALVSDQLVNIEDGYVCYLKTLSIFEVLGSAIEERMRRGP